MRTIYFAYLFMLALVLPGLVYAQPPQFYNGVTGNSYNAFPLNSATSNHVQWLYGPNLFGSSGTGLGTPAFQGNIVKVYFRLGTTANGTNSYTNFQISMGQNMGTTVSYPAGVNTFSTTLTTVFFQSSFVMTGAAPTQWYGITLQTPFAYDPTLSLIFDIKVTAGLGNQTAQVNNTGLNQRVWALSTSPTGSTGTGLVDFGFDLVPISTAPNDAGVASIDTPSGGCEGLHNVVATVKNFGINQVDTVTVNWTFNGQPQTPVDYYQLLDTFNGAGSNKAHVFLGTVTLTGGQADTIVAWTTNPNNQQDTVTDNDTTIKGYFSLPTIGTFPYYQDFESGQADWVVAGTNSSWAFGTPAKTNIIGTGSGINAFVTGGLSTGLYSANENSQVKSPCFDMRDFEGTPWVALDVNWFSQAGFDGATLQSSVDGGTTWQNVGKFQDPNNWFNDNSLDGRPGGSNDGWAGIGTASSVGWKRAKHVLPLTFVGSVVNFRIAFGSDATTHYDGFAFDDFTLVDFRKPNLGPDTTSFCGNPTVLLDPKIPLNGGLAWSDGDSSSLTKTVNLPGLYWVSHTDSMINEIGYDTIEIVQTPAPQIAFDNLVDTISVDDYITLDPQTPYNINYTWTPGGYSYPYLLVEGSKYGVGTHVFHLHVVDSVLCEDMETITVVILDYSGVEDQEEAELSVYPNPVESTLVLDLRNVQSEKVEIRMFDISGKLVYSNAFGIKGSRRIEMDLSSFEAGPYMLQMNSDQQSKTLHIIKK